MLAHKNGCMAWSARQGIPIKDICDQKLIQERGYVTTIIYQIKMYSKAGQYTGWFVHGSLWVVLMCRCGLEVV